MKKLIFLIVHFPAFFSAMSGNNLSIGEVPITGTTASATTLSFKILGETAMKE